MQDVSSTIDFHGTANRFRAIGQLMLEFSDPDQLRRLVDVLVAGDADGFHELIDSVPDFLGKCHSVCAVVREVIDIGSVTEVEKVERCALRLDLSPAERRLALEIALRHRGEFGPPFQVEVTGQQLQVQVIEVIPPGPYLDELKANGLVFCWIETITRQPPSRLGPRTWQCANLCI